MGDMCVDAAKNLGPNRFSEKEKGGQLYHPPVLPK